MSGGDEISGTFACPICGVDIPHHHTAREQAWYRIAQIALPFVKIRSGVDERRSYGGAAHVCTECGGLGTRLAGGAYTFSHQKDCTWNAARRAVNPHLAVVGLEPIANWEGSGRAPTRYSR